jgi:hypothetical protein
LILDPYQSLVYVKYKNIVGRIAIKASAVINACQYSFIFGLNPNDIHDLVELYSKSCPINDIEAESIAGAERGVCFLITSPQNRRLESKFVECKLAIQSKAIASMQAQVAFLEEVIKEIEVMEYLQSILK